MHCWDRGNFGFRFPKSAKALPVAVFNEWCRASSSRRTQSSSDIVLGGFSGVCRIERSLQHDTNMNDDGNVSSVRVLVVDDFEPFRSLVRSLLEKTPRFLVVREVSD